MWHPSVMPTCPSCHARYADGASHCTADGQPLLPDAAFTNVDPALSPGEMVGEYRIERKIGEGGFGAVYAAVHPLIGKRAALKTLHREHSKNPQIVARFIAEAKAVNQIRHRNIIDIFSFGTLPDGRQYFLMELLDGCTFEALLQSRGRLPLGDALPILRGVARALDAAHAHGIAHRDLKPENIFLVADDAAGYIPKLLDFGVAKLAPDSDSGVKTRTGAPIGTPYYMSPEQARGVDVDFRSDIYALGVVCFQVLTGRVPFDGQSMMDVLMAHMATPAARMSEIDSTLSPDLDAAVAHMLEKDPALRPASAGAAIAELEAAGRITGSGEGRVMVRPLGQVTPASTFESDDTQAKARTLAATPSTTFPSVGGDVTPSTAHPRARGLTWVLAPVGLCAVALAWRLSVPSNAIVQGQQSAAAQSSGSLPLPATPPVASSTVPAPTTVEVTVAATPPAATPTADASVEATLKKPSTAPPQRGPAKPAVHKDLENPFK
jgi:eukaryotic-like serine/threonine-protein kinase